MSQPVIVIATFAAQSERRGELRALLEGMIAPTRSEEGCRRYDLYDVPADGDLVLIERYDDEAALDHHRTTGHYRNYRRHLGALIARPISVKVLAAVDEARPE